MQNSDIIGGSTAARRIHGPGSVVLETTRPKGAASEFAERGTALHEAMEHYLLDMEGQPLENLLGMTFNQCPGFPEGWTIDQALLDDKIKPAHAAFLEIIKMAGGGLDYMIEVTVDLKEIVPGAFGTVDVLGVGKDGKLYVIDWKFGDGVPVEVASNYQMAFYTAGALYDNQEELLDMLGEDTRSWDIVFCVVQPRVGYPDEPNWQSWETNDVWVESYIDLVVAAFAKMQKSQAEFIEVKDITKMKTLVLSEGEHCRFCRANLPGVCPQKSSGVQTILDAPSPSTMDEVTIAKWLDVAERVEETIKELKSFAHTEAERGVKIPGWKCVPKRGSRVYTDAAAAEKAIRKKLKVVDAFKKVLISPAQAEKKMGKESYGKLLAQHVTVVSSGTTLARDTDRRPDVSNANKDLQTAMQGILSKPQAAGPDEGDQVAADAG
jgi:hypothetical protein